MKTLAINSKCMWGLNYEAMNPNNKLDGDTIIARVFDAGDYVDMKNIIDYYGVPRVSQTLLNYPDLQLKTINHVAIWLGKSPEDFYAYQKKKQAPIAHPDH